MYSKISKQPQTCWSRLSNNFISHVQFIAIAWLLTTFVILVYAIFTPPAIDHISRIYLWTVPFYYHLLLWLAGSVLVVLSWHRYLRAFLGVGLWLWLSFLLINLAVFNLYDFHLDLLLLEMFFLDFRGLGLPWPLFLAGIVLLILVAFVSYSALAFSRLRRVWLIKVTLVIVVLGLPIGFLNQAIHAWAAHFDQSHVTQFSPYFPLHVPTTSGRNVEKWSTAFPAIRPEPGENDFLSLTLNTTTGSGRIQYPKTQLLCENPQTAPVVLVILESWQTDSLQPEVMPNTWALSKSAHVFEQHISSGAATVPGFFGLMYGLHPSYYNSFRSEARNHPALITEIAYQQGYRLGVISSGDFERFALRTMFFSKVAPENFHYLLNDLDVADKTISVIENTPISQHTFDVIFFTSSHSPYRYPASYQRFTPVPAIKGAFAFNKHIEATPFKNDYLNSLHYVDHELGRILEALKASGRFDKSWIVVTGDHAEEFNESGLGLWGHGSSFSRWQTGVPLLIKQPDQKNRVRYSQPSFHQDIAPTLLQKVMGCTNPIQDMGNGLSLFNLPDTRNAVLASYSNQAYWMNGSVWERNTGRRYEWANPRNTLVTKPEPEGLRQLIEEETRFFKP
jgi:membrane-anchored protein YejM (alkaline phosphatase superfamily)